MERRAFVGALVMDVNDDDDDDDDEQGWFAVLGLISLSAPLTSRG